MSRVTAPLLSFGASGQIAKSMVASSWKGRAYFRRYVIPSDPNTTAQQETRSTFRWLMNVYKYFPGAMTSSYNAYGDSLRISGLNGWIKQNLSDLRSETDLTNIVLSPAANGGIPATGISVAPGAGQLAVTLTAPALPTGWSIVKAHAVAIRQQDPQTGVLYEVSAAEDATDPYVPTITGLTASQVYVVGGWFEFLKPDGTTAYGRSLQDTGTPS